MSAPLAVVAGAFVVVAFLAVAFVVGMRRRSLLVHRPIFWISRRWLNPKQMRTAGHPGAYAGIIRHVGRRTGRAYETPVGVMATEDGLLIALPYGRRPSWLQNVLTAGSATIVHEGVTYPVTGPRIVPMAQVLQHFAASDRLAMRILRTDECLRLSSR
jgi:deazaflavin-dependent oxidoreductase (nitroreductase family)